MQTKSIVLIALVVGLGAVVNSNRAGAGSCCGSGGQGSSAHSECSEESAMDDPSGAPGLHAGSVTTTKANGFETVLRADGVRIYRYTKGRSPRSVDDATGKIEVRFPDGSKSKLQLQRSVPVEEGEIWFCPMHASVIRGTAGSCPVCGMDLVTQDFLFAPIDLSTYRGSNVDGGAIEVKVELRGLGETEEHAKFTQRGLSLAEPGAAAARLSSTDGRPDHVH